VHYPNFTDIYYLEQGIIVLVGGFHKPSLPYLAGIGVKSKATTKSIRSKCIYTPGNTKGGNITVPLTSCLTGLESAV